MSVAVVEGTRQAVAARELPTAEEWGRVQEIATTIAQTEFVPQGLRNKPAAIVACILAGREMGIGPMQSLRQINVIQGTPSFEAELQLGLVYERRLGRIEVVEKNAQRVVLRGVRFDNGAENVVQWTMEDAAKAGLAGKSNWKTYPRQMLWARAVSELVTQLFPDATSGIGKYGQDEIGGDGPVPSETAVLPSSGEQMAVVEHEPPEGGGSGRGETPKETSSSPTPSPDPPPSGEEIVNVSDMQWRATQTNTAVTPTGERFTVEVVPPEEGEPEKGRAASSSQGGPLPTVPSDSPSSGDFQEPMITDAQKRKIYASRRKLENEKVLPEAKMLDALREHYGTEHVSELTVTQASDLIDRLEDFERKVRERQKAHPDLTPDYEEGDA